MQPYEIESDEKSISNKQVCSLPCFMVDANNQQTHNLFSSCNNTQSYISYLGKTKHFAWLV